MHLRLCFLALLLAVAAHADELTKNVQSALKEQGFYYGEVTGLNGPDTAAAVKRYQIRNGLEVTGTLTKETLDSLDLASAAPAPATPAPTLQPPAKPPVNLHKDKAPQDSDREFLRRQTPPPEAETEHRPPPPSGSGSGPYGRLFARTPYASAPLDVQQGAVTKAQRFLRGLDFYHESIDGQPSPALEEGILSYQHFIKLPLTGQLDLETLAAMRLLPGRGGAPVQSANPAVRALPGKPLRGVWIK
jgi:peptidoglycan hydrolase-like protein with peptidoglycan-binding domain